MGSHSINYKFNIQFKELPEDDVPTTKHAGVLKETDIVYIYILCIFWTNIIKCMQNITRADRKFSSHFEYLENRSGGLDLIWQQVRGDITVHP